MTPENAYGNIPVYSPEGILMFKTNEKKLRFYKKNKLIESYHEGFRLLFTPKGLGYHNAENKEILTMNRQNKCVVSGEENISSLTRHHIIPILFRKWMPEERKSGSYQMVVLIRKDLHYQYTKEEQKFYEYVAGKYGVIDYKDTLFFYETNFLRKKSCVQTLRNWSHRIPEERLRIIRSQFRYYTGLEPTNENYTKVFEEIKAIKNRYYKNADYNFGKSVVEKIINFGEFEKMWIDHFISVMNPKFFPEDLKFFY